MKPGDTAMFALALALCALGTRSLAERDALAHNSQVPDQPPALQARLSHPTFPAELPFSVDQLLDHDFFP